MTVRNSTIHETTGGDQAAIEIQDGAVDLGTADNSGENEFYVHGSGQFIRNLSSNPASAVGNEFSRDDEPLDSESLPYRIEDGIFHALDEQGRGLVTYDPGNVYVTGESGSIQRGIDAAAEDDTVNVEQNRTEPQGKEDGKGNGKGQDISAWRYADYTVGERLLTVHFQGGPALAQSPDPLEDNDQSRMLEVTGTSGDDRMRFVPGEDDGTIDAIIVGVPNGTFAPTSRLVAEGQSGDDDLEVAGGVTLDAWLYGGSGNDRLKAGGGRAVLLGGEGNDRLHGGAGRNILVGGEGADRLHAGRSGDVVIGGKTKSDESDEALLNLLDEWNSDAPFEEVPDLVDSLFEDDGAKDILHGGAAHDLFFAGEEDQLRGNKKRYTVL